jgi:zinc transport system ATP-binding protein
MTKTKDIREKDPLVSLQNISAGYQGKRMIEDVNLNISRGDFIGVIGPNGGGKTTLLRVILGLIRPYSGNVVLNIDKSQIGYLPQVNQFDDQFPITVSDVVLSGLSRGFRHRSGRSSNRKLAEKTLETVGIASLRHRPIGELSGGELQRTMLARAIISSPELLVLDEPNTYVDNTFEQELYRILNRLNATMTIVLVSHDIGIISPFIKTIACVNRSLHYHPSNEITSEQLKVYNCPIELVTHGPVPHRVMQEHNHEEHGDH